MKKYILVLVMLLTLLLASCGAPNPSHGVQYNEYGEKITEVVEYGTSTYVPINMSGLPEKNMDSIQEALDLWTETHTESELVSFEILYMQATHSSSSGNYTYGILIYHRPAEGR